MLGFKVKEVKKSEILQSLRGFILEAFSDVQGGK